MNDGLQFLQIHLNASVSCDKNQILTVVRHTGSNYGWKIVSHRSHSRIGDKPLSLFHPESLASRHPGGSHADKKILIFFHGF